MRGCLTFYHQYILHDMYVLDMTNPTGKDMLSGSTCWTYLSIYCSPVILLYAFLWILQFDYHSYIVRPNVFWESCAAHAFRLSWCLTESHINYYAKMVKEQTLGYQTNNPTSFTKYGHFHKGDGAWDWLAHPRHNLSSICEHGENSYSRIIWYKTTKLLYEWSNWTYQYAW